MTLRLGLLAAARIAEPAVVEPARRLDGVEVVAVAAREGARARDAAERWGIPTAHGSYEGLLSDADVDAVYVATPTALHRPWALAALAAGKHLLLEKPLASNAQDAAAIVAAAETSDLVAMEAFHSEHHPLRQTVRDVLDSGVLGGLVRVDAMFDVAEQHIDRRDIRWQLALGGGAMLDIGIYAASFVMWAREELPEVVSATATCPVEGVDGRLLAALSWSDGVVGSVYGSMLHPGSGGAASLVVEGTAGVLRVTNPVAPQLGASVTVETASASVTHDVPSTATYDHQLVAFRDAVRGDAPVVTTLAAGARRIAFVDACYRAAGLAPRPSWPD